MVTSKDITQMLKATNERDNVILMVEHARNSAAAGLQELNKPSPNLDHIKFLLQRITALNPPATSTGSNVNQSPFDKQFIA